MEPGAVQVVVVPVVGDKDPPVVGNQKYETTVPSPSVPIPVSGTVPPIATEEAPDIEQVGALLAVETGIST